MGQFDRRDFQGGAVSTTILGSITALDVSWQIADATGWPQGTNGPFFAVLNRKGGTSNPQGTGVEEKILVASLIGTTVTLADPSSRGVDGTTGQAWSAPTTIEHCFTATDADEANLAVSQSLGQIQGKGDLLVGRSANRYQRVAPGSDGTLLQYDSTQPGGMIGAPLPPGAIANQNMFGTGVVPATALVSEAFTSDEIDALTGADLIIGRTVYQTDTGTFRTQPGLYLWTGTVWQQPWNQPWGRVTSAAPTASQTVTTPYALVPGMVVSGTGLVAGRRLELVVQFVMQQQTADGTVKAKLIDVQAGNVDLPLVVDTTLVAGQRLMTYAKLEVTSVAGAFQWKLDAQTSAGSLQFLASSGVDPGPMNFWVNDLGPA